MKRLILLVTLAGMACALKAEKRSLAEAQAIAAEKMSEVGIAVETPQLAARRSAMKASCETYSPYYVFNGDNNDGFVIVSGDDCLPDIVGYGTDGNFEEDDVPDCLAFLLEAYTSFVEDIEAGEEEALARARQLKAIRRTSDDDEGMVVEPLLGDIQWGQGEPYNSQCPTVDGNATVSGCVSVALAQVMKYYNHPQYLLADIPGYTYEYTYNGSTYSMTIDDIAAGTEYDWDNMLSSYSGDYTDEQSEAVSTLIYHCGVAGSTKYNVNSSGGGFSRKILNEYFGFDLDLSQVLSPEYLTLYDWMACVNGELANSRPILMAGNSVTSSSSHAFICDGMDSSGLYHINWGWSGSYNGYFDITMLNPHSDNDGYTDAAMYVGLAPDNGVEDDRLYAAGLFVIANDSLSLMVTERTMLDETFSGQSTYTFSNRSDDAFSGLVALGILDNEGEVTIIGDSQSLSLKAMRSSGSDYRSSVTLTFNNSFSVGTYAVVPVCSTDEGMTWSTCYGSDYYGFVVEATETKLTIAERPINASIVIEEELLTGFENTVRLDINNSFSLDYYDYLYFYGDTTDTQPSTCTEELYIRVPAKGSKSYDIEIEVGKAAYYYVWVEDASGNLLIDGEAFPITYNPDPVLTITGVTTNASTTDYETENAYLYDDKVKVPIIYDDKFILTSTIENTGGLYRGNFYVKKRTLNSSGTYTRTTIRTTYRTIPANSTTTFCDTVYSYEFDDQLANVDIMKVSDGVELNEISKALQIYKVDTSGYYNLDSNRAIGYFYEGSSGVNSVKAHDYDISACDDGITITSDVSRTLRIYSISGQLSKVVNADAGERVNVSLPSGIYIVDGKKLIVR